MNIRKYTLYIFSAFVFLLGASEAQAQQIPPGSYQQSCFDPVVKGSVLETRCNLSGGDKQFKYANSFEDFFMCADDLRNNNGQLTCTKSEDSPLMKKAKAAIAAAFPRVHGRNLSAAGDGGAGLIRLMFKTRKDAVGVFYKGLTTEYALKYLSDELSQPSSGQARLAVIDRAFKDVYGAAPQPAQVAAWNAEAGKLGYFYESIVLSETQKLNKDEVARVLMISKVYRTAMGRPPTKAEVAYWKPKKENHKDMLAASREWLYSTGGAKDLVETIQRAYQVNFKKEMPKDEVNGAIIKFTAKKAIYDEIVTSL